MTAVLSLRGLGKDYGARRAVDVRLDVDDPGDRDGGADAALDRVLALSTDPVVKERARLYKAGQTWLRPQRPPVKFDAVAARARQAAEEGEAKEHAGQSTFNNTLYIAAGVGVLLLIAACAFLLLRKPAAPREEVSRGDRI